MDEKNWMELLSGCNQIRNVMDINRQTERFGLVLTEEDARTLMESRKNTLKEQQRVEFGEGILPKMIFTFCDSQYIYQENYVDTILRLQEIFYLYKNEAIEEMSDDELLDFMKHSFDGECQGTLEYLEGTALEEFARDIRRKGKRFYIVSGSVMMKAG